MQKGIELLRLTFAAADVRVPLDGESFTPAVHCVIAKAARDDQDVLCDSSQTGGADCGKNPRIIELARELLALCADEIAAGSGGMVFVAIGETPDAFTTHTPDEPPVSRRPAPVAPGETAAGKGELRARRRVADDPALMGGATLGALELHGGTPRQAPQSPAEAAREAVALGADPDARKAGEPRGPAPARPRAR